MKEGQGQGMICSLLGFVYLWNQGNWRTLKDGKEERGRWINCKSIRCPRREMRESGLSIHISFKMTSQTCLSFRQK